MVEPSACAVHGMEVLAMKPGGDAGLLPDILAEYDAQPQALPVEIVFSAGERPAMLRDGRADVALLLRPQDDLSGQDAEQLLTEQQVVLLPPHTLRRVSVWLLRSHSSQTMRRWRTQLPLLLLRRLTWLQSGGRRRGGCCLLLFGA